MAVQTETKPEDKPVDKPAEKPADKSDDDHLGEAGLKALQEERRQRSRAEKEAADAKAELEKVRAANMSESEKAIAQAKADGKAEALGEVNARLIRSEIRVAAAGKLTDPEDAAALLGDLDRFVGKDGTVDTKAITSAIDGLVKDKPYLAAAGSRARPLPGGGAKPSSGVSFNDEIRRRIRGG